jgi:PAS domain S-box-containing protein
MGGKTRKTGIDILGAVPWGTHFCQFYKTKEDLIDILVSYFKAGLENNEFCMWVTSEPLSEKEAKKAMREAVPNFDRYQKKGQIEIMPYEQWYLKEGAFNIQRVLNGWIEKLNQALAQGYDGLRLTGNTFWLEKKDWKNFTEYEEMVNNVIGKYNMMAICSYYLDKCGASEVIDVVSNHQFALIRKEGKWELIESSQRKKAEEALRESEERYRAIFDQAPDSIVLIDGETGDLVEFNERTYEKLGYTREEFKKLKIPDFEVIESAEEVAKHIRKIIGDGSDAFETKHRTKSGEVRDILVTSRAISIEGKDFIQSMWNDMTDRKRAEEELESSREQLRNLAAHLQSAREEERRLIAREIHDELGQSLTALKMDLFWLDKRMPIDQKPLLKKTKSMSKLIDKTVRRIKKISAELRPGLLDYLGLPAAVEWEGEEFQNRTGIKCEVNLDSEDIILDQDRSTALFRIFQEALTNAARHSNATRVKVSLKEKAGKLELRVRDNGKGITEKQISNPKSFGLIGMRERAQFLGGDVEIRGVQDKATTIIATIPLPKKGKT